MVDEQFWASTLVSFELLHKIALGTVIVRPENDNGDHDGGRRLVHKASGHGPFGKLTQMGLFQMVEVGNRIRDELCSSSSSTCSSSTITTNNNDDAKDCFQCHIWDLRTRPPHPKDIRILCTDFPRTIQSVQGLLVGLFPDGIPKGQIIPIDCRHTNWMIPDPQPRRSKEQEELEWQLATRPYMQQREHDMLPLAIRCTNALRPMLGKGAFEISFGVGEPDTATAAASHGTEAELQQQRPLPWAQLAEITKCLKVRNRLPPEITPEDQRAIMDHTAWRWFESLRDARLIHLVMHKFATEILHSMRHYTNEPPLVIYSGHDSTLIALLCVFRLEQPSVWPEYGSYLKIELLEVTDADIDNINNEEDDPSEKEKDYVVRFFLNGQLLRSNWDGEPQDMIPLHVLAHNIKTVGAIKAN